MEVTERTKRQLQIIKQKETLLFWGLSIKAISTDWLCCVTQSWSQETVCVRWGCLSCCQNWGGAGIPLLDTLQQFHIVNPLLGQANTPTSHPSQYRLFRDAGEPGDDFLKSDYSERRSVGVLHMERLTERGFQHPRLLFSLWVLRWTRTLIQPQFAGAAADSRS